VSKWKPIIALLIALLVIPAGCQPRSGHFRRHEIAGGGAGDEAHHQPVPAVVYAKEGACPSEYPYCLSAAGFDAFETALNDLHACEGNLTRCQTDLDAVPREVEVTVERVVEERTPWWNWVLIGALAALIPVGIGVGFYLGAK
jgi:hypothetical protein